MVDSSAVLIFLLVLGVSLASLGPTGRATEELRVDQGRVLAAL